MKKAIKTLIGIMLMLLLFIGLTGCANVNYEINLKKDGSGEVSYIIGYDKNFLNSMQVSVESLKQDNSFDDMKKQATQEGYEIEVYEDDNTYGFKAHKKVNNIQEDFRISQYEEDENRICFEKTLFKTSFSQNAKLDLSNLTGKEQQDTITTAVLGQMKISYKIVLPFKVGQNNATTVSEDGKTLEWTLKAGQTNEVQFTAEQNDTFMVICIGIAIIGIIFVIFIVMRRNNSKKTQEVKPIKTVQNKEEIVKQEQENQPQEDNQNEGNQEQHIENTIINENKE